MVNKFALSVSYVLRASAGTKCGQVLYYTPNLTRGQILNITRLRKTVSVAYMHYLIYFSHQLHQVRFSSFHRRGACGQSGGKLCPGCVHIGAEVPSLACVAPKACKPLSELPPECSQRSWDERCPLPSVTVPHSRPAPSPRSPSWHSWTPTHPTFNRSSQ